MNKEKNKKGSSKKGISKEIACTVDVIQQGIKKHNEQLRLNPKSEKAYTQRTYAFMRLADVYISADNKKLANESLIFALDDCQQLLKLNGSDYNIHVNIGLIKEKLSNIQLDDDNIEKASALLQEAVDNHTKAIQMDQHMGSLYYIRGNVKQSLAYLQRKLGKAQTAEKLTISGIDDYDIAISLHDINSYASRAAARVLLALYKKRSDNECDTLSLLEDSVVDYDKAIDYAVDKPKLLYLRAEAKAMLAELHHKANRMTQLKSMITEAIVDYKKELEDDPEFYFAHIGIASVLYLKGDVEFFRDNLSGAKNTVKEAEAACQKALELAPRSVSAYYENAYINFLGAAIAEREQDTATACKLLKQTIDNWDKAIKIDSKNPNLKERRDSAQTALNDLLADLSKAPKSAESKAKRPTTSKVNPVAKKSTKIKSHNIDDIRKSLAKSDYKIVH